MKKFNIRILALFLVVVSLLALPINAQTQASDYIHCYMIDVYTIGKEIYIDFEIDATATMTKLGASSIKIYEYPYGSQDIVCNKTEYSAGMSTKNDFSYSGTITYTGSSNKSYKVDVTVFARDTSGSDSRSKTVYVST